MTAQKTKIKTGKKASQFKLSLTRSNYLFFGIGMVIIIIGYIFMAQGPWNNFWSLTLAPILLVIAYAIIIPVSIMFREKRAQSRPTSETGGDIKQ